VDRRNIALNTAVLTNGVGALFETQGAGSLVFNAGFSRFDNAGTFASPSIPARQPWP